MPKGKNKNNQVILKSKLNINGNTQNTYKNAAKSASRKNLQIAVQDAKRQEQKQSSYFEIQAQHQCKHFAQFIEINKTKIANKINIRYKKKLQHLKRKVG